MTDLQKWHELERLEFMGEIDAKRKALDQKIEQIRAEHARRGILQSGATIRATSEARDAYRCDLIITRIGIRKKLGNECAELLSDVELNSLQEELESTVQVGIQADRDQHQ